MGVPPATLALFATAVAFQLVAIGMLPRTSGFTDPLRTGLCAAAFVASAGLLSRVVASGVSLGVLVPLMSASTPLASIGVGVLIYGETASLPRVALLSGACALIGLAARLG